MQDEILTRLAGIRDLKVISRSSTEQYASMWDSFRGDPRFEKIIASLAPKAAPQPPG